MHSGADVQVVSQGPRSPAGDDRPRSLHDLRPASLEHPKNTTHLRQRRTKAHQMAAAVDGFRSSIGAAVLYHSNSDHSILLSCSSDGQRTLYLRTPDDFRSVSQA
ncbi:unnamed protein product [Cuscuta epithymum]|uniref:Uncharacterized protein n=1 Tax=Cuscuta epithymum TaxID=186058 RepID=A0AAV0E4L6_9ASTE|nr:unnamed protein product [Cuscuta epithymum]